MPEVENTTPAGEPPVAGQGGPPQRVPRIVLRVLVSSALAGAGVLVGLLLWWGNGGPGDEAVPAPTTRGDPGYPYDGCRQCHADLDRTVSAKTSTVIFSHTSHFSRAIGECAACHLADTHIPDKTNRPTMDRCYQCHGTNESSKASGRCLTCHPANFIREPESHSAADWSGASHAAAARADRPSCLSCHSEKTFCGSCHAGTGPPSHQLAGWSTGAHRSAAQANRAQCLSCHNEQKFCAACHANSRPASHQIPGWANGAHESQAEGNRSYCLTCHNERTFCATCHAGRGD